MKIFKIRSDSSSQTVLLGSHLLKFFLRRANSLPDNIYIKLIGELSSGKTTFASGFLTSKSLHKRSIASPTFNILKVYDLPLCKKKLYHIDLYRIPPKASLLEFFTPLEGDGIWLIEWAERLPQGFLPENKTIEVKFSHPSEIKAKGTSIRHILIKTSNPKLLPDSIK